MARLNVEMKFFTDPRFKALCRLIGDSDKALGMVIRAWFLAQEYWGDNRRLIPPDIWKLEDLDQLLICLIAEQREEGIYLRGAAEQFEWIIQRRVSGRLGGQKSATSRLQKHGTAIPVNASNQNRSETEAPLRKNRSSRRSTAEAPPKPLTLTPALTLSENYSNSLANSPPASSAPAAYLLITEIWKQHRGQLADISKLTPGRKSKMKSRWTEKPDPEYWAAAVKRMAASSFCAGGSWASFDWLMKNSENHVKVLEGKYDNRDSPGELSSDDPKFWEQVFKQ